LSLKLLFISFFSGALKEKMCKRDYLHCEKELAVLPSPAGMSLIKLFLGGNNLVFSRPERVWSVTSRLGTGKRLTLFYSVGKEQTLEVETNSDNSYKSVLALCKEIGTEYDDAQ
jgi:hypothetical protein